MCLLDQPQSSNSILEVQCLTPCNSFLYIKATEIHVISILCNSIVPQVMYKQDVEGTLRMLD